MKKILFVILIALVPIFIIGGIYSYRDPTLWMYITQGMNRPAHSSTGIDPELEESPSIALDYGIEYLLGQLEEKNWKNHPGISALCLRTICESPQSRDPKVREKLEKVAQWLLELQQDDGAFYITFSMGSSFKNYTTSLVMLALISLDKKKYESPIQKAQDFLVKQQKDEGEGYVPGQSGHGGVSYGEGGDADLNHLSLAIEALKESGLPEDHPYFKNALQFVERSQDSEANTQAWSKGDTGGFIYSAEKIEREGGEPEILGSMTFAGLNSLVFLNVDPKDEKIQQAKKWINKNFSVSIHPGKKSGDEQVAIYYYYYSMAKALTSSKIDYIQPPEGEKIDWRKELAAELIRRQSADGSWSNQRAVYLEGYPELASAYAAAALTFCIKK